MKFLSTLTLLLSLNTVLAQVNSCDFLKKELDKNIQCGYLVVPENHEQSNEKKIKIAYAILKSKNKNTKEFPAILLNGGPGGQALSSIERWVNNPMRETRDLIVFDQRGIGFSSPLPNPDLAIFKILAGNFSVKEEYQLMRDTLVQYKQKCIDNQIALECYITSQSAADVNTLMENLGYQKYVVYGESYGTRLARVVMDKFPKRISCVIADAPAILEDDFLSLRIKNYNDGLEKIFRYCENDPDCKEKNPNIRKDYVDGVTALAKAPLELNIGGKSFFVNPQDALFMLRYQLYAPNSKASVPGFIKALKERDTNSLNASQQFLIGFVNSLNLSLFISTGRNEEYDAMRTDNYFDGLYSTLPNLPAKLGFFTSLYKASIDWHTKILTTEEKKLKPSTIPTLIFVNKFDPVTPPKNGFIFKETLPNAKLFVLDLQGHGVTGDCATQVMIDFMSNPKGDIDSKCLPLAN
jgi:pimeloyl-ACP methyl ester carboxylesterase